MSIQKKVDPTCIKKGNRPKIEDVINHCLDSDLKKSALDFSAFMRENKINFKIFTSCPNSQRASYKGYEICSIMVIEDGGLGNNYDGSQYWSISPKLYNISKYDELAINEGLANIPWEVTRYCCFKDNPNRTDVNMSCIRCKKGLDRTIFGIEYRCLCHHYWPTFANPDETTVKTIKRLLELEQMAREDSIR